MFLSALHKIFNSCLPVFFSILCAEIFGSTVYNHIGAIKQIIQISGHRNFLLIHRPATFFGIGKYTISLSCYFYPPVGSHVSNTNNFHIVLQTYRFCDPFHHTLFPLLRLLPSSSVFHHSIFSSRTSFSPPSTTSLTIPNTFRILFPSLFFLLLFPFYSFSFFSSFSSTMMC